jgi:hypothetical protein
MKLILINIFFTLFLFPSLGVGIDKKESLNFHKNAGCPTNSHCSIIMGKKRHAWVTMLSGLTGVKKSDYKRMNSFLKKEGIPIPVWSPTQKKQDDLLKWNSQCPNHNKESTIWASEVFAKDFNHLKSRKDILIRKAYTYLGEKLVTFPIFRGEVPLMYQNGGLVSFREDEGKSFALRTTPKGKIEIVFPQNSGNSFVNIVKCPQKLVNHLLEDLKKYPDLYSDYFCQAIEIDNTKKYQTFLLGTEC